MKPTRTLRCITILGGGLAGLGLGIGLRQHGVPVTLHEAGSLPRHRVCGEFLCGRGREALRQLGAEATLEGALDHSRVRWYRDGKCVLDSPLPAPAWGLSRHAMDARLASQFEKLDGELHLNSRIPPGSPAGNDTAFEGVVHCIGRRKCEGRSDWLGLKVHAKGLATQSPLEIHLGEGAYVGLSGVEDDRTNVCALFRRRDGIQAGRREILLAYLEASGLASVAARLRAVELAEDSFCGVGGIEFSRLPAPNRTEVALGDQYALIPPFTGNGMSIALESAALAVPPLLAYSEQRSSWEETCALIAANNQRRFGGRLKTAARLHPFLLNPLAQTMLIGAARFRLLPFQTLYRLTH